MINFLTCQEKQKLRQIRETKPIVCCLTNAVTINDCANIVLAFGGRPIMSTDLGDIKEILKFSKALVLNIGTIKADEVDLFIQSGKTANILKIPVILDPCGCQATSFRFNVVKKLLQNVRFSVIKCNQEELKALYKMTGDVGSFENLSFNRAENELQAKSVAKKFDCIVCISGKIDIITDCENIKYCKYGNKIMSKITGCGCMLTCVVACFCAVNKNCLDATYTACCVYGKKYKKLLSSHIKTAKTFN